MNSLRRGFTLLELLIAVAIIGALVGMLLPAVQRVREAAKTASCQSNLHQLGIAVHTYLDMHRCFPTASGRTPDNRNEHVAFKLRSYIEESSNDGDVGAAVYLCPSRRDTSVGAKLDYGTANMWLYGNTHFNPTTFPSSWRILIHNQSMSGGNYAPTSLADVSDGLGSTLLFAHKGLSPRNYFSLPSEGGYMYGQFHDIGWIRSDLTSVITFDFERFPYCMLQDKHSYPVGLVQVLGGSWLRSTILAHHLMTSPHPGSMPCLWGDASVRNIAYSKNHTFNQTYTPIPILGIPCEPTEQERFFAALWYVNDGQFVPDELPRY